MKRTLALASAFLPVLALAQDAAVPAPSERSFEASDPLNYVLFAAAVVQVIFILSLAGIMRTMGGPGAWMTSSARTASAATCA